MLSNETHTLAVKISVTGIKERWKPGHAKIMQSEADTMACIKQRLPHFPSPDVFALDLTFENEIGAPFMVISFLEGKASNKMWVEQDEDD